MTQPRRYAAHLLATILAAFALAACGGHTFTPAQSVSTSGLLHPVALGLTQFSVPNVAGTYNGTITVREGTHSVSGTVVIDIKQSGSSISGTIAITINGQTKHYTLAGTVSAITGGAKLKFVATSPSGRKAKAHATVYGKHLNGKAYAAPSGNQPAVYFAYKTVRQ